MNLIVRQGVVEIAADHVITDAADAEWQDLFGKDPARTADERAWVKASGAWFDVIVLAQIAVKGALAEIETQVGLVRDNQLAGIEVSPGDMTDRFVHKVRLQLEGQNVAPQIQFARDQLVGMPGVLALPLQAEGYCTHRTAIGVVDGACFFAVVVAGELESQQCLCRVVHFHFRRFPWSRRSLLPNSEKFPRHIAG